MFDPWLEYGILYKSNRSKDQKFDKIKKRIKKQKNKFKYYQLEIIKLKDRIHMKRLLIKLLEKYTKSFRRWHFKNVHKLKRRFEVS